MLTISVLVALAAAAEPAPSASAGAKPEKEKMICKKEPVTGSLARVRKTCMTQAQWNQLRDQSEEQYDRANSRIQPTNGT